MDESTHTQREDKLRILIVEDDRVSAVLLRRMLEQLGHTVTIAENGMEAWQVLRSESFALVITDWMMPSMDGVDLSRRIRASGDSRTYLILLSSRDRSEDRPFAVDAGADDFLTRPFDCEELFARIRVAERLLTMKAQLESRTAEVEHLNTELVRMARIDEKNLDEIRATCRDLEVAHAQLKARSITDSLTGLKNHREFQERLDDEISRASRYHLPLSLIMLDVDHFKRFNDRYGHPAGDEVLRTLAQLLKQHARETDILARYGGEEFAVILASTDRVHAIAAAERFRTAIADEAWPRRAITVSMGISTLRIVPQSRADLTTEADLALYTSKSRGRNCVAHYSEVREAV